MLFSMASDFNFSLNLYGLIDHPLVYKVPGGDKILHIFFLMLLSIMTVSITFQCAYI